MCCSSAGRAGWCSALCVRPETDPCSDHKAEVCQPQSGSLSTYEHPSLLLGAIPRTLPALGGSQKDPEALLWHRELFVYSDVHCRLVKEACLPLVDKSSL